MFRVKVNWSGLPIAGPAVSTLYMVSEVLEAQDCVDAAEDAFTLMLGAIVNSVTLTSESEVAIIDPTDGSITGLEATTPFAIAGTNTEEAAGAATQGLVRWRTGVYVGGREVRGRTFIGGVPRLGQEDGKPTSGYLGAANAFAASWRDAGDNASVVWSRKNGVAHPIVSASAWNQFAVLRSRRD